MLEQGWSAIDLFAEVLEGADPVPRLHQLGMSPAEIDQSYEKVSCEERGEDEKVDEEDHHKDGGQVPG